MFIIPLLVILLLAGDIAARPRWSQPVAPKGEPHPSDAASSTSNAVHTVLIVNLFQPEADVFQSHLNFTHSIPVDGLSPLYPDVHCDKDYTICQVTLGESEINAAASSTALFFSSDFNLTSTYIFSAGIAGVNPKYGTVGDAGFAAFVVQNGLQYELDARELPSNISNFTTGYWAFGTEEPGIYPTEIYGTEVFKLNTNLLDRVLALTKGLDLVDNANSSTLRAQYTASSAAQVKPSVKRCDIVTSDQYFTGNLLGDAFANYTKLMTNGTGFYCFTAQEDNAIAESLVRATVAGRADYSRWIAMRTASDFDRAPPGQSQYEFFERQMTISPGPFDIALDNLWTAGWPVIKEIAYDNKAWSAGVSPQKGFYGDILGTLDGLGTPAGAVGESVVSPSG